MLHTLTVDEVLQIHEVLVQDFASSSDPISPSGIRSKSLLESAVHRQTTGLDGKLKYDTAVLNAASLAYGICSNHPFFNGNKRASLVAMLCHLDKNHLTLDDTVQADLYQFMLQVAAHDLVARKGAEDLSDAEVAEMGRWLKRRTRHLDKSERVVTFRQLAAILRKYGFELTNRKGNFTDIVRTERRSTWFGLSTRSVTSKVMTIAYPSDGQVVGKSLLRAIRERCGLSEQDGVDSEMFYTSSWPPDFFVARYRKTLRKLAKV